MGRPCDWSCRDHPPYPPFARGGKRAQRNRDESPACARPTFYQLSPVDQSGRPDPCDRLADSVRAGHGRPELS